MTKYVLVVSETISTVRYVEAADAEEAEDKFYQQGITGVMFLDHEYPDEGEWEVDDIEEISDDEFNDRANWKNTID